MSTTAGEPLLHLTTPATWRVALSLGTLVTPSLLGDGFIHLSPADQVALPANRLFAARDDVLLLVVDQDRLRDEVRWEPGAPSDPASVRFPHLYGPLPTAAVTSVVPYRPDGDGRFVEPFGFPAPGDRPARARAFDHSLAERRAAAVVPVTGGVAVLDPRVAASHEHNSLWITDPVPGPVLESEADRVLEAYRHRRAVFDVDPPEALDWQLERLRLMVLDPSVEVRPGASEVTTVTSEVMAGLWGPSWRRDRRIGEDEIGDLLRREAIADAHARIVDLAVLDERGVPIAGTQLRIDGATASIEAVMAEPDVRARGHAGSLVAEAVRRAREAGCDVVFLAAAADDWPRQWYGRLGFVGVADRWEATKVLGP